MLRNAVIAFCVKKTVPAYFIVHYVENSLYSFDTCHCLILLLFQLARLGIPTVGLLSIQFFRDVILCCWGSVLDVSKDRNAFIFKGQAVQFVGLPDTAPQPSRSEPLLQSIFTWSGKVYLVSCDSVADWQLVVSHNCAAHLIITQHCGCIPENHSAELNSVG